MKKLKQYMMLSLLLLAQQSMGQIPAIDSLKIIPENPVTNDEVKVICYTTFPSGTCDLSSHSFDIQGGNIVLDLDYNVGSATYICHSVDTVSIGYLHADDYELVANLKMNQEEMVVDTGIIHFSVEHSLGISETITADDFYIYPNPFDNELSIKVNSMIEKVEIFSFLGEKIKSVTSTGKHQNINLSDLNSGMYLIVIVDDHGNRYSMRGQKN